jgi:hypothetical protein
VSASKMRGHAMGRNFSEFKKGIPSHVHPEHAKELYDEVRKAMHIEIGPQTSGISLARYAKRNDEIGHRAKIEQKRREEAKATIKVKNINKAPKIIKAKDIKEEVTADSSNDNLKKFVKLWHGSLHRK